MAKSLNFTWATDDNYSDPGEAWDGQPTKVLPSAGDQATGYLPEDKPPGPWWNYKFNNIAEVLADIAVVHVFNFSEAHFDLVASATSDWRASDITNADPGVTRYNPISDYFFAVNNRGNSIYSIDRANFGTGDPANDGSTWQDETTDPRSVTATVAPAGTCDAACSPSAGTRVFARGNDATGSTYYAQGINDWSNAATATSTIWHGVDFNTSTRCCLGGEGGAIDYSNTGISGWASATVTLSGDVSVLKHNRETGSDACWVALTSTEYARSSDGITWTSGAHGLTGPILAMAYSALGDRWGVVNENGDFGYSDNNGVTWTEISTPFDNMPAGPHLATSVNIATDGQDSWIVTYEKNKAGSRMWASLNNGANWGQIYSPSPQGYAGGGPAWGANRFVIVGRERALYGLRVGGW